MFLNESELIVVRNTKSVNFISCMSEKTPLLRYDGKESFENWHEKAYKKLWEILGLDKMVKCEDDDFFIDSEEKRQGYKKIHFSFQTEPDLYIPCYGLFPDDDTKIKGIVICIQGHSTGMHISIGEAIFDCDKDLISGGDRDFALRAIKEGYAAVCMEQRYTGECGCEPSGSPSCFRSGRALPSLLLGRCAVGERVWDVMRLIDVLEKYFPSYSKKPLICLGNSGGGTTTFYASCIDTRIDCSVPSCAVCTYKDSIVDIHHCSCNYIPGIAEHFDMGDIGGLIAPRKLVVVNGREDNIFPLFGVKKATDLICEYYKAAGCENNFHTVTGDGGHRFYADAAWEIINKII